MSLAFEVRIEAEVNKLREQVEKLARSVQALNEKVIRLDRRTAGSIVMR